jgi:hypothetical protein
MDWRNLSKTVEKSYSSPHAEGVSTSAAEKGTQFCDHGGGAISMVSKNWKLFVACLSGFWLREILLDHLKKKIFPTETKKLSK